MKHLKYFENISNENRYWRVSTKMPEFAISLEKIGVPKDKQQRMLETKEYNNIKVYDDVYVGVEYYATAISGIWTWDEDGYGMARYMGEVKPTEDEIKKWEFNNDINKYNL